MAGKNRYLYDSFVRTGTITPVTAGDYQPAYPIENIRNMWTDCVYRSNACADFGVQFELSASTAVTCVALFGLNLTAAYEQLKLQRWTTSWVDVANLTYSSTYKRAIAMFSSVSSTKFRIIGSDDNNPDGYFQLGAAILGSYIEPNERYDYGASNDYEAVVDRFYSKKGHVSIVSGYNKIVKAVSYEVLDADVTKFITFWNAVGNQYPFCFVDDSDNAINTMMYSILIDRLAMEPIDAYFTKVNLAWETVK